MKNKKKQLLNTDYNKAFKFRFYPDSEQVSLLNHFFGSARFVFNQTLSYSINHYQSKEHLITDDYGDLIVLKIFIHCTVLTIFIQRRYNIRQYIPHNYLALTRASHFSGFNIIFFSY